MSTNTMRAAVLEEFGPPDVYTERVVPIPQPGAGEVLIRVQACGICGEDAIARRGAIPHYAGLLPLIQGHELAGEIVSLGSGVTDFGIGDRVAIRLARACHRCEYCRTGLETMCRNRLTYGEDAPGGYGEYCVVDAAELIRVPDNVDISAAAIAACAIGVALRAFRLANLRGGQRLVVTGAGGGIGVHALQISRAYGVHTVAVTSSPKKKETLEEFAHEVIVGPETFSEEIRRRNLQPDVVLELTSGITLEQSLRSVKRTGTVVIVGNIDPRPVSFLPGAMIMRETTIRGSGGSTHADVVEALRLISEGDVKPILSVLPIEKIAEAHQRVEEASQLGRVVVTHRDS